jgi:prolipoprotein diacylglyceryltransferase
LIITGATIVLLPLFIFLINAFVLTTPPKDGFNIAFSIGGLDVAWYGIFIFIGFMAAIFIGCIKL